MTTSLLKQDKSIKKSLTSTVTDAIAVLLWTYALLKLFVFDVDVYLGKALLPTSVNIANYRYFAFIALALVLFLALGKRKFFLLIAKVIFFPLILVHRQANK